jgi:site-specific recombinase XerD
MSYFIPEPVAVVKSPEMPTIQGRVFSGEEDTLLTIGMVAPLFLEWSRYEMRRSPWTVRRYGEGVSWVIRHIGDRPVSRLNLGHLLELRKRIEERGCGEARIAGILNSLRSLLKFCREVLRVEALDPRQVRLPRIPKREVVYLTKEEVGRFLGSIMSSEEDWETVPLVKLRLRALAEVLLGTGARISEILQLKRNDVRFDLKEARTIGKGNKERTLFFSDRSLAWLERYLTRRHDEEEWLFVTQGYPPKRLNYESLKKVFERAARSSGITKKVSPHILRHTMATTLLFNGCPIGHIKELLGHERLDTTCRYYLGLDMRAAKKAHGEFLRYE